MQIPSSWKKTKGLLHNQEIMNGMETYSGMQSPLNLLSCVLRNINQALFQHWKVALSRYETGKSLKQNDC